MSTDRETAAHMDDARAVPRTPPSLLPGRPAVWWGRIADRAVLCALVCLGLCALVGWLLAPLAPGAGLDVLAKAFLLLGLGAVLGRMPVALIYRHRARAERDAGYTTMPGELVILDLGRGPAYPLFGTAELWHLDGRTGAVLRRPDGATPEACGTADEEPAEFVESAARVGRTS